MAVKIINNLVDKVKDAFKSKEYRHAYADEFLNLSIATQIKVLREQREWTQTELGNRVNPSMKQTRISIMENVNYSSWSINTLRKLAEAFDLRLRVSFESFGSLVKEIEQFNRNALERHSFDADPVFKGQHILLSTSVCATTSTSTVNLTIEEGIKEANPDIPHTNEIPPIDLEHKEARGIWEASHATRLPRYHPAESTIWS